MDALTFALSIFAAALFGSGMTSGLYELRADGKSIRVRSPVTVERAEMDPAEGR